MLQITPTYYPNIKIMMTDLYDSNTIVFELAQEYREKITKWLKQTKFGSLLQYFVVKNGQAKFGIDDNNNHVNTKIKYIKKKILTPEMCIRLIEKVKMETGLSAHDFSINKKWVKYVIYNILKTKFKKYAA